MKKTARILFILVALLAVTVNVAPRSGQAAIPSATIVSDVYTDSLNSGWQNWSWGSSVNLQDSAYRRTGNYSASCAYTQAWAGLYFGYNAPGFNTTGYDSLNFFINGGASSGQFMTLSLADAQGNFLPSVDLNSYIAGGSVAANTWRQVVVPLAALQGTNRAITGLVLQEGLGHSQPRYYIDDMQFVGSTSGATATPTFASTATAVRTATNTVVGTPPTSTRTPTRQVSPSATRTSSPQATATLVSGLPPIPVGMPGYFSLGLFNADTSDIPAGSPWNFRYPYLAGGANTGDGWASWNNPPGQFALNYILDTRASNMSPAFIYYQILQSSPHFDEYSNLNDPSTMFSYFDDFKLLMQKCAQAGVSANQPIFVAIEPDLTGVMQQHSSNSNDNAALQPSSVSSSGHPDVQGIPNTFKGVYQALAHIRDLYAPGVSLGIDVSPWGADDDITLVRDPSYDWQHHAARTAAYLNSLGGVGTSGGYQLLFYSPSDRDSAWYLSQGSDRWWDDTNTTLPNFNRMAEWMGSIIAQTQKRAIIWQVPNGNRLYRSENNTNGHWQDNRPEYFLNPTTGRQHMQQWANYGFVGLMFGAGVGSQSHYFDAVGDGITNPPAINGNNQAAQYSDDDGGYIRLQAASYYSGGAVPLPQGGGGATSTATRTPLLTNTAVMTPSRTSTATSTHTPAPTNTGVATSTSTLVSTFTPSPTRIPTTSPTTVSTPTGTATPPTVCERVAWVSLVNVTASRNMIQKSAGANNSWNAGAVSSRAIQSGDGYVQVTVDETTRRRAFGLSKGNTNAKRGDIDFAAQIGDGVLRIFESNTSRGTFGVVVAGDVVRVAVEGGLVKYYLNGSLKYTSAVHPTYPLLLDTSIYTTGGRIADALVCARYFSP